MGRSFFHIRFVIVAKLLNAFHVLRKTRQKRGYCEYINPIHLASMYRLAMDVVESAIPKKKKPNQHASPHAATMVITLFHGSA